MTHISFSSLFGKNNMGEKTDWVGKKLTSQIFPRGKKLTGQFFPRGKTILSPGKELTGKKLTVTKVSRIKRAKVMLTPNPDTDTNGVCNNNVLFPFGGNEV